MRASSRGYLGAVKLLLRCPETQVMRDYSGYQSHVEMMEAINLRPVLSMLNATCCLDVNQHLLAVAKYGNARELVGLLKCLDADINTVDEKGRTPLYLTSLNGKIEILDVILDHPDTMVNKGINVDGGTAFSIASERGHDEIMEMFISSKHHNTDVNDGWCSTNWTPGLSNCKSNFVPITTKSPTTVQGEMKLKSHR